MKIIPVTDPEFSKYGKVITDIDFSELCQVLKDKTPLPEGVEYVTFCEALEALPVMEELSVKAYGEMPIQIGYCNGHNKLLNALEYHRDSEINIAATAAVLMLGKQEDITPDMTYDTSKVVAFLVPAGTAVEVYATTLHYAPCDPDGTGFKVAVVLPRGTNEALKSEHKGGVEDSHLTAVNKWLLGHPEGVNEGDPLGLIGENLSL